MKKNLKYLILAVLVIVLVVLIYLVFLNNKNAKNKVDTRVLTPEEKAVAVLAQQKVQKINNSDQQLIEEAFKKAQQAAQDVKLKTSSTPAAPTELKVEFMTDAEKSAFNIPASTKVQILSRNEKGIISAYKVIKEDSDIVTKF